jgi:hypothetical protein
MPGPTFTPDLEHDRWRSSQAPPLSRDPKVDQKFFAQVGRRRSSLASPLVDTRRASRLSLIRNGSLPRLSVKYESLRLVSPEVPLDTLLSHSSLSGGYGEEEGEEGESSDRGFEGSLSHIVNPLSSSPSHAVRVQPAGAAATAAAAVGSDVISRLRAETPAEVRFGSKSLYQFPSLTPLGRCISPAVRGTTSISRLLEANLAFVGIAVPPRSPSPALRRSPSPAL